MNSRLTQNSTALNALTASKELSQLGSDWVTQTLDPFHDWQILPSGYPDTTAGQSFIQAVTLTKTTTIDLVPKDIHIFTLPQLTQRTYWQFASATPTYQGATSFTAIPYGNLGPVNIVTTTAGMPSMPYYDPAVNLWVGINSPLDPSFNVTSFDFSPYLVGESRLVSLAFEVHNTTAELLKSGSVVTYRSPQSLTKSQYVFGEPADYPEKSYNVYRSVLPPANSAEALLLAGSQQWEAYDGAYSVATLCAKENPAAESDYIDQMYEPNYTAPDANGISGIILAPRENELFPNFQNPVQVTPWNTNGAYFAGLQVGTVLNITVRAYIECFPEPDQKSYLSLTRPSCPFDPLALELYSRAAYVMKPATKVGNNAGGDHWRMVKSVLAEVAPKISKVIAPVEGIVRAVRKKKGNVEGDSKLQSQIQQLTNQMTKAGLLEANNKQFGVDLQRSGISAYKALETARIRRAEKREEQRKLRELRKTT
jgi:hypothetical protein